MTTNNKRKFRFLYYFEQLTAEKNRLKTMKNCFIFFSRNFIKKTCPFQKRISLRESMSIRKLSIADLLFGSSSLNMKHFTAKKQSFSNSLSIKFEGKIVLIERHSIKRSISMATSFKNEERNFPSSTTKKIWTKWIISDQNRKRWNQISLKFDWIHWNALHLFDDQGIFIGWDHFIFISICFPLNNFLSKKEKKPTKRKCLMIFYWNCTIKWSLKWICSALSVIEWKNLLPMHDGSFPMEYSFVYERIFLMEFVDDQLD